MNFLSVFMCVFSILGGVDYLFGSRFGLGKEFERGFRLLGTMALSMIGMIVIAPLIGDVFQPLFDGVYNLLGIDPSVLPAILLANDMGGAPLAMAVAKDEALGSFNALVVSSMMGATISFSLPYALNAVKAELHDRMMFGLLCGIVTIPAGCFVAGLTLALPIGALLYNLLPLLLFSILIVVGLLLFPKASVRIFGFVGMLLKGLIVFGLLLGLLRFLTGIEIIKGLETFEEGARICFNATAVMSGAFPFLFLVSKLLSKPLGLLAGKIGVSEASAMGLLSTLATAVTTFEGMDKMDDRGIVLNAAFTVSAGFTFAGHLAFTMSMDGAYVVPMIVGKLVAGILAVVLAALLYKKPHGNTAAEPAQN